LHYPFLGLAAVRAPRDLQQVQNIRAKQVRDGIISTDALYNLSVLSQELTDNFIVSAEFLPHLCITAIFEPLKEHIERIARLEKKIILHYDTTFNIGKDAHLSVLLFRHTMLTSNPVVVVAFMLHNRKHLYYHRRLFELLLLKWPFLAHTKTVIVTDREFKFEEQLPNATQLYCWNHMVGDVKRAFSKRSNNEPYATERHRTVMKRDIQVSSILMLEYDAARERTNILRLIV
jgi:hypothetical protein